IEGENNIEVPLKKYKAEQDADPAEGQNPGDDPNDPNGGNGSGGSDPADDTITIYVKYDPDKQGLSSRLIIYGPTHNMPTPKENDKDGKTPQTAFGYINSAVEWIAANGDITKNYKILLTDYGDTPFNQGVYFGSNLNYKAKSIILTSYNPNEIAIASDETYSITAETRIPVILEQIKVSTAINGSSTSDEDPFILLTQGDAQVTLGENTVFEGKTGITSLYGTAVYMLEGSVTMEKNAKIKGFSAQYAGGAVYIKTGSFLMKDNSEISDCHTTVVSDGGGAFFLTNIGGPHVISYLTIEDDAKIINCSTKGKGGAISVDSGKITMNSGSITGCTSYYEEGAANGLGGAIYLGTANHADTIAILNGGTISGNTAERRGSAIYVDTPSSKAIKLKMGGNIFIDPESNDIFVMKTGNTIELADDLITANSTAALITLYKNSSIQAGVPVIESNDTEIIGNSYSKLQIRLEDSEAANGYDSTSWRIDENGLLAANN
ncbi:MAG: hypothetical protein K6G09_01285, partial [Treponema sp.]|nr:hypothetical protein [Treponema sp.]